MNSVSEIVEEVNALEAQRTELEENRILQVCIGISSQSQCQTRFEVLTERLFFFILVESGNFGMQ